MRTGGLIFWCFAWPRVLGSLNSLASHVLLPKFAKNMARSRCPIFLLFLLAAEFGVLMHSASAQIPPGGVKTARFSSLSVRIRQDSGVTTRWRLGHAELRESIIGAWGVLDIENVSPIPIKWVRFYAEYFDEAGRICFALVFASQANAEHLEGDERPVQAGEMRQLLSLASDMGPGVQPVEVRVRMIEDSTESQPLQGGAGNGVIRSPVVINSEVVEPTITLKLDQSQQNHAIVDMIFSKLQFGLDGSLQSVEILHAANAEVRRWFEALVHQKRFGYPATAGLADVPGIALLLVRIPSHLENAPPAELLPRSSTWVQDYVKTVQGNDIPPITQLLISRSADLIPLPVHLPNGEIRQRQRVTNPDLFEYTSPGSEWCGTILGWAWTSGVPSLTWRASH
jgi:hypothetical protein